MLTNEQKRTLRRLAEAALVSGVEMDYETILAERQDLGRALLGLLDAYADAGRAELAVAEARCAALTAERDALRAQLDVPWQTAPPTSAQIEAHEQMGGWWQMRRPGAPAAVPVRLSLLDGKLIVTRRGSMSWETGPLGHVPPGTRWRRCTPEGMPLPEPSASAPPPTAAQKAGPLGGTGP